MQDYLWVEKYRPRKVKDVILPEELKSMFQEFVDQKNIPNLLLSGGSGTGKTSISKAMLEELECDYIVINSSMNGNIDTLRNEIHKFASTVSFSGGRKYVILDEADHLTATTQAALRNFMEEFSKNCGFILTCNFKSKIIEPLHSRCAVIDFKFSNKDIPSLAGKFLKRICSILDNENVEYDKAAIAEVIKKHLPDWRRILNEIQRYSPSGKIDSGILANLNEKSFKDLIEFLKEKDFTNMRKWVAKNSDIDQVSLYRDIYDNIANYVKKDSVPLIVLLLGKYSYQHVSCADPEINLACCLTELMIEASWD